LTGVPVIAGTDVISSVGPGRFDAEFVAISNGCGNGGIAGFIGATSATIGEKLPGKHPHRQLRSVNGVIRFAEATLVVVQSLPNQRIVQKIAKRRLLTWKKRNEKRRHSRMRKLPSFFWGKSGRIDIQKALLGLLSRFAVQRGRLIIAKRGIPVKGDFMRKFDEKQSTVPLGSVTTSVTIASTR